LNILEILQGHQDSLHKIFIKLEIISSVLWTHFSSLLYSLNNDYIFSSPLVIFNIIFLPENKGNPVSKVPDASYSPCPENVIIQFPCHWADFIVLGGISILPPLFLLKLLNVLYRSNYKTRLNEYEKETKNGVWKTFMGVKTLSTMNIMFFFSHREF